MKTVVIKKSLFSLPWYFRTRRSMFFLALILFCTCSLAIYIATRSYVVNEAEKEIQSLLLQHRGVHQYIQHDIHPELYRAQEKGDISEEFYSPILFSSSYMVRNIHAYNNEERIKAGRDSLYYKIASDNPRNPVNLGDDKELEILEIFRADRNRREYREITKADDGRYLQLALPFLDTSDACLKCHGVREDAPPELQHLYPAMGGFQESTGSLRAIESIRVHLDDNLGIVNIVLLAIAIVGLGLAILLGVNYRLSIMVSRQTRKLQESEERFRTAFNSAVDCILIWDKDYNYLYANQSAIDHVGTTADKVIGKNIRDGLGHIPDFMHLWMRRIDSVFATGESLRVQDKSEILGKQYYTDSYISPVLNTKGEVASVCCVYRDITEVKRSEAETRRFKTISDGANFGYAILDLDGIIQYNNTYFARAHGFETAELENRHVGLLYTTEQMEKVEEQVDLIRSTARFGPVEIWHCKKDGTEFPMLMTGFTMNDERGNPEFIAVTALDITANIKLTMEKEKVEDQYQQAKKVESIGRLAGGVAHDLNNLLTPIIGYGELLQDDLSENAEQTGFINEILFAGLRARSLVGQLLAFSRKQTLEYIPMDMSVVVSAFEPLLRRTIREDIEIQFTPRNNLPLVMADVGQIEQVVMNLAVNAGDAMPGGGVLTIELATADLDDEYAETRPGVTPGKYVMLAISDTGCGIDEEVREHLFEPFFTTKGEKGTGLGLATVYGIVKQHGGNIWVYSELDQGTVFKVYLPVSKNAKLKKPAPNELAPQIRGNETILLAEDNEHVRTLVCSLLSRNGYSTIVASNGPEALVLLEKHRGPVDLLLTDVVMPGMNGKELYLKAVEKYPDLKVIYMSGYSDEVIAHRGVLDDGVVFIQKPFTAKSLAMKIRQILGPITDQ